MMMMIVGFFAGVIADAVVIMRGNVTMLMTFVTYMITCVKVVSQLGSAYPDVNPLHVK